MNSLLGGFTTTAVPTAQGLLDAANLWRDVGVDVDGNDAVDQVDAIVMFLSYNPNLAGLRGSPEGVNSLLGGFTTTRFPTAQELLDNALNPALAKYLNLIINSMNHYQEQLGMKQYLQIITAFALTTILQAASAQPTVTPRLTILDGDGNPMGTSATVFAGSNINVRLSVELSSITSTMSPDADNFLSGVSLDLDPSFTSSTTPPADPDTIDGWIISMLTASDGFNVARILQPQTDFSDQPASASNFLNTQTIAVNNDPLATLRRVTTTWSHSNFDTPPLVPRGVWCPAPVSSACTLEIADITLPLPSETTAGRLTLAVPEVSSFVSQGDTMVQISVPDVTFDVVSGYEFSIAGGAAVDVAEGDTATFDVTLSPTSPPITELINVPWSVTADATTADDFGGTLPSGSLMFAAGTTTQTISIDISADMLAEGPEMFTLALDALDTTTTVDDSNVSVTADTTPVTVTIAASDVATVSFASANGVAVVGQTGMYSISLDNMVSLPLGTTLSVPYTVTGTAATGEFTATPASTIPITGSGPGVINIEVPTPMPPATIDDVEGDTIILTLGAPSFSSGGAGLTTPMLGTNSELTLTIVQGFVISMVTPDPDPLEVGEGETAQFMAALMPPSATAITVSWTVSGSGDDAAEDADFAGVTGSTTFEPGETRAMIDVTVADDAQYEAEEGFTVTLGTPTPATADFPDGGPTGLPVITLGSPDNAADGLISDDPLTVVLTGPADVREGQTETYTVSLNGDVGGIDIDPVMVDLTLTPMDADGSGPIEAPGEGTDYNPSPASPSPASPITLTIPRGQTQATLEIEFVDDEVADAEERLDLALGTIGGGGTADIIAGDPALIEITISEVDIEQRTQAMENTLAVFGRSVAGDLVRMMEARTSSARSASQGGGSQAIIGGKRLSADWLRSALSGKKAAATGGDTSTGGTTIADGDGNTVTGAPALVGGETTALGGGDFVTGAGGLATDGDTSAELSSIQPTVALVRDGLSMIGLNFGETGVSYHSVDLRRLLAGSSFQLALNGEGGQAGSWTVWGRGSITNFDGRPGNDFSVDGDMFSGQIGIDTHVNANMLAGLAVNYSEGDSDYDFTEGTRGNIETELTSVHPYVQWSGESGLDLWVMLGYGEGDATLEDESGAVETDLDMKMAAAGVRRDVDKLGYLDWALKADVFFMRLEADEQVDLLNAVEADTWRLRLALEGSKDLMLDGDASMKGIGEIGWRLDGGDAETGMGIEIGGGLDYANPNAGLTVTARGHYLLAHRDSDFDEWGASISASFDPGVVGRGLRLSLTPTLGAASGGADRLWEDNSLIESAVDNLDDSVTPDMTMGAEAAYGMAVMNDRGLFTPFSELSWSDQNSRTRLGARMELLMPSRMDIGFAFYGEQEYRAGAADGVSGVLESRVRRSFAHDMGVIDLFGKMQSGTSDDYQIGVETKLNF